MNISSTAANAASRSDVFLVQSAGSEIEESLVHSRRTKLVLAAAQALVKAGKQRFTQADIGEHLRGRGEPMSAWEVRVELTTLETSGEVAIDTATAHWLLTKPVE